MTRIFMASLGCVKNLVDAETMLGETLGGKFSLALNPEEADLIIINTCGFIKEARREAREVIGEYLQIKLNSRRRIMVVAAGCWAERSPEDIRREFPQLDAIWGLRIPSSLHEAIANLEKDPAGTVSALGKPAMPREGARLLVTPPSYAYLKISDGCDNRCHYCAIPLIRGGLRSRSPRSVLEEAMELEKREVKELVIIAQDITAYGHDLDLPGADLTSLVEMLLTETSFPRIRLLYAHPAHIREEVIDLLLSERRLCGYLDLPLQHVADSVLAGMGRGYGADRVDYLLDRLGEGVTLRTTLMTGFPGETEADFLRMLDMVERGRFRHLGVFAFSPERDTPAAALENRIPPEEAARRRDELMKAQQRVAFSWLDGRIGKTEEILVDSRPNRDWLLGRSVNEAPDADGAILIRGGGAHPGKIVKACIDARDGYDLLAKVGETGAGRKRRRRR